MSVRNEQCKKVCKILDDVLANRPQERDALIVAVQKAFDALADDGWIPVEDRPPDNNTDFLLQFKSNMGVGFYEDGDWTINTGDGIYSLVGYNEEKPIAWRELPKPYEPQEG